MQPPLLWANSLQKPLTTRFAKASNIQINVAVLQTVDKTYVTWVSFGVPCIMYHFRIHPQQIPFKQIDCINWCFLSFLWDLNNKYNINYSHILFSILLLSQNSNCIAVTSFLSQLFAKALTTQYCSFVNCNIEFKKVLRDLSKFWCTFYVGIT